MSSPAPEGRLRLRLFEGPLDLLLYLIRKSEIDVHDIPIVEVTSQYQAMLHHLRENDLLDLDFAGDYFLMAATLIQIKTRMLLPRPPVVEGEEPIEDPRKDLVQQLLEYERYKEAAMLLREKGDLAATTYTRPEEAVKHLHDGDAGIDADLVVLARAFRKVLEDKRLRTPHVLAPSRYTVRERMEHVLGRLGGTGGRGLFTQLFEEGTVEEAVVTFLALLELVKRGALRVVQARLADDIELELVPEDERPSTPLGPSEFDAAPVLDEGSGDEPTEGWDAAGDDDMPAGDTEDE